jgi:hypothetical protein
MHILILVDNNFITFRYHYFYDEDYYNKFKNECIEKGKFIYMDTMESSLINSSNNSSLLDTSINYDHTK